jgi:Protein of unknown function (DUF4232)
MRPVSIAAAVVIAAGFVTGCSVHSAATRSASAPQPSGVSSPVDPAATSRPQPGAGPATPTTGRCAASALASSVLGSDGAAGTIWTTVQLRNVSGRTCTVKGTPEVRLLGANGQPVTAPSRPDGPTGSLVVLRPGAAARFTFHEPNVCDDTVAGSRLRVTLPAGRGSLVVELGGETRFGTCASVGVQALQAQITPTTPPLADRISDPQVAADRLVAAWLRGDREAARRVASRPVIEQLFRSSPPAHTPPALPCRLVDLGVFMCSYTLSEHAELSIVVEGGASVGYRVTGLEFGD